MRLAVIPAKPPPPLLVPGTRRDSAYELKHCLRTASKKDASNHSVARPRNAISQTLHALCRPTTKQRTSAQSFVHLILHVFQSARNTLSPQTLRLASVLRRPRRCGRRRAPPESDQQAIIYQTTRETCDTRERRYLRRRRGRGRHPLRLWSSGLSRSASDRRHQGKSGYI